MLAILGAVFGLLLALVPMTVSAASAPPALRIIPSDWNDTDRCGPRCRVVSFTLGGASTSAQIEVPQHVRLDLFEAFLNMTDQPFVFKEFSGRTPVYVWNEPPEFADIKTGTVEIVFDPDKVNRVTVLCIKYRNKNGRKREVCQDP